MKRYCYNMTFLVSSSRRSEQVEWITNRVGHLRRSPLFSGVGVRMSIVLAVPGMADYGREETSVTAQFEFDDEQSATAWGDSHFMPLAGAYSRAFGSEAYVMPAVIEQWEVE